MKTALNTVSPLWPCGICDMDPVNESHMHGLDGDEKNPFLGWCRYLLDAKQ